MVGGEAVLEGTANIVALLSQQAFDVHARSRKIDRHLAALQHTSDVARRLATIPGIGTGGATALTARVTETGRFRSGRQFAAWLGLTPLLTSGASASS